MVSQDVWMGGWYSGCYCGRGNTHTHLLTAFGVFLAGLGGLLAVNGIVSFFSSQESGALSRQVQGMCFSNQALFTTVTE